MTKKPKTPVTERERPSSLHARADQAGAAERERLLVQLRQANEKLVLASLQAQQDADDAMAARAVADDSASRFESLVLMSSALVWRATAVGRFELDPVTWRDLTGLAVSDDEWTWLEAVHPLDRKRVRAAWSEAIAARTPYACQHRMRTPTGGYVWMLARAVPIVKSGIVREWIGMMTDVTDRVRVEEARDQFIGILGHDLRNPLTSILGGIEQLRNLPEPYAKTVARLARSTHRIDVLVDNLLDFARGHLGGGIPITPRRCDMGVICRGIVDESRLAHAHRSLRYEGHGDLRGEWDAGRIEQVISNLVGNAIVHGLDPIVVTSRATQDRVVTSVHNRGAPIPEALLPTLFEPFTRGAYLVEDQRATSPGLGLGVYIASQIVHAHCGTLTVSSTEDEGTTFTLSVPRITPRR